MSSAFSIVVCIFVVKMLHIGTLVSCGSNILQELAIFSFLFHLFSFDAAASLTRSFGLPYPSVHHAPLANLFQGQRMLK
jgi:hypothetical protein